MPECAQLAVRAWNMMAGLDWNALPVVCELIGVDDVEALLWQLLLIRDRLRGDARG